MGHKMQQSDRLSVHRKLTVRHVVKDFGVMTLTFWGHVTSSVTRALDSQYTVFYRRSFETNQPAILHNCWDMLCQTFIAKQFPLKMHLSPFLFLGGKTEGCNIFQLWAYSGPRVASCEPLTAIIGPVGVDSIQCCSDLILLKVH